MIRHSKFLRRPISRLGIAALAGWALLLWPTHAGAASCSIRDFGAVGDGETMNTAAIQQAVDACGRSGGGRVVVPPGTFLTGTITLKSGVDLSIDAGATLLGSTRQVDYRPVPGQDVHGLPAGHLQDAHAAKGPALALIIAADAQNVTISGDGTIDGQGRALAADTERLLAAGAFGTDDKKIRPDERHRPQLIDLLRCKNGVVKNVLLKDSACWVQTYNACDGLTLDHVRVNSTAYWNNDGVDLVDCKNTTVRDCDINSADDGICLKSHDPGSRCDNIQISRCKIRSSANAIKFGTASAGGFRNITVSDVTIHDTFYSAVALESVDGGDLEHVQISHVTATNIGNAVFIRRGQRDRSRPPGIVRDIVIQDLSVHLCTDKGDRGYEMEVPSWDPALALPSPVTGLPGYPVEDVTLKNIEIFAGGQLRVQRHVQPTQPVPERAGNYPDFVMFGPLPAWGFYFRHVDGLVLDNVQLHLDPADPRPPLVQDDVVNAKADQLRVNGAIMQPF